MRPLSLPLPMRDTSALGGYREAVVLPHRYGAAGGTLLQANASRTEFVWADHAVLSIDSVLVNGLAVGGWDWRNTIDAQGHPIALVRFAQPQDEGAQLIARGRGKRSTRTGELMINPADVVADVLALAGRDVGDAALAEFRRECAAAGLEVGGSIESAQTPQVILRAICDSIGAVVCADMPGWCRLWPAPIEGGVRRTVRAGALSASTTADDLVNDLAIAYAHEAGAPRATVRLEAGDAIARMGRRSATLPASWLTSARVAAQVGQRLLQQRARPNWSITVSTTGLLRVGDVIALAHPASPASGTYRVLSRDLDLDTGTTSVGIVAPVGDVPAVRLVAQSAAFDARQYASVGVETIGGERVLTLRSDDGTPIVGAAVTLDDSITRYTDAAGRVSFPAASMPPGEHTLSIVTADGRTLTTTVLIP